MVLSIANGIALVMISAVLIGTGFSLIYPTLSAFVAENSKKEEKGTSLGFFSTSYDLGFGMGSVIMANIQDFRVVFFTASLIPLLGIFPFLQRGKKNLQGLIIRKHNCHDKGVEKNQISLSMPVVIFRDKRIFFPEMT